jgi:hypothetical protein
MYTNTHFALALPIASTMFPPSASGRFLPLRCLCCADYDVLCRPIAISNLFVVPQAPQRCFVIQDIAMYEITART